MRALNPVQTETEETDKVVRRVMTRRYDVIRHPRTRSEMSMPCRRAPGGECEVVRTSILPPAMRLPPTGPAPRRPPVRTRPRPQQAIPTRSSDPALHRPARPPRCPQAGEDCQNCRGSEARWLHGTRGRSRKWLGKIVLAGTRGGGHTPTVARAAGTRPRRSVHGDGPVPGCDAHGRRNRQAGPSTRPPPGRTDGGHQVAGRQQWAGTIPGARDRSHRIRPTHPPDRSSRGACGSSRPSQVYR